MLILLDPFLLKSIEIVFEILKREDEELQNILHQSFFDGATPQCFLMGN